MFKVTFLFIFLSFLFFMNQGFADDGYNLWLKFKPVPVAIQNNVQEHIRGMYIIGDSPTMEVVQKELMQDLDEMLGKPVPLVEELTDNILVVGKVGSSDLLNDEDISEKIKGLKEEGFALFSSTMKGHKVTIITGKTDKGVLYGRFPQESRGRQENG